MKRLIHALPATIVGLIFFLIIDCGFSSIFGALFFGFMANELYVDPKEQARYDQEVKLRAESILSKQLRDNSLS